MILRRYFFTISFKAVFITTVVLVTLLQLADFFTVLWPKLEQGIAAKDLLKASIYNLPKSVSQSLSFAMLFSGAYVTGTLIASRELLAARSCGMNTTQFTSSFIVLGLLLSLGLNVANGPISTYNSKRAAILKLEQEENSRSFSYKWANGLFYSEHYNAFDKVFYAIIIVETDNKGQLTRRINAETAHWNGTAWQLTDVRLFSPHTPAVHEDLYEYDTVLNPTLLSDIQKIAEDLSTPELKAYISLLKSQSLPYRKEELNYYQRFSDPWVSFLVSFFPIFIFETRKNAVLMSLIQSISLAVVFYIIQMLFSFLSEGGRIAAPLAAFFPLVLMTLGMSGFKLFIFLSIKHSEALLHRLRGHPT